MTVLCFSDDPGPTFKETARVLQPRGSLVIGELGKYSARAVSRRLKGWLGSRTWSCPRFWKVQEARRSKVAPITRPAHFSLRRSARLTPCCPSRPTRCSFHCRQSHESWRDHRPRLGAADDPLVVLGQSRSVVEL